MNTVMQAIQIIYFIGKKKAVAVAQLVERLLGIEKVRGLNPISTI